MPQTAQVSAATKSVSYSLIKGFSIIGKFLWTLLVHLNLADTLKPIWAYANNGDGKK